MVKNNIKPYLVKVIVVSSATVFCLISYLFSISKLVAEEKTFDDYEYVSKEVLPNNEIPVIKEKTNTISKPYQQEDVIISKTFYDYTASEQEQEKSINYYENTYIQNKGVDYTSENLFHIHSILDGKVISITEDDIVGKTIKIEHNNGMISTYQSLSEIMVKENDTVEQNQIIGTSGTNSYNKELGNHLHFELFYKDKLVNPEEYFGKEIDN